MAILLVVGVVVGLVLTIQAYNSSAYYAKAVDGQIIIYHGRVGHPTIGTPIRTGVSTSEIPSYAVPSLASGVQESTKQAVEDYVASLVAAQHQSQCTATPNGPGCSHPLPG